MHDFYFDIDELPGPIIKSQKRLLREIPLIEQKQTRYAKKYQRFARKYNPREDGTGAKQAVQLIRHELQSRLK
jgi:CDP-glycerol glycerophosphotransferase